MRGALLAGVVVGAAAAWLVPPPDAMARGGAEAGEEAQAGQGARSPAGAARSVGPAELAAGAPTEIPKIEDWGEYGLDGIERVLASERGKVKCPKVKIIKYAGDVVRYHKPVWVYEGFVPRLRRFEAIVREAAIEVYGRPPHRIKHLGTYNCRRIAGYPGYVSEHGLANAIDVSGFSFPGLPKAARRSEIGRRLPKRLRGWFKVDMLKHWGKTEGVAATHARFLDLVARRVAARKDIFRTLLGPAWPNHDNHFHFDAGPFREVSIWE